MNNQQAERVGSRAHSARVYDCILGGKDHYEVDRLAAEASLAAWPGLRSSMLANRAAMRRMAHWLAAEAGIRQFLDIGTGIPTEPNLHQVVQQVAPETRIVYVDNDPVVLAHADALMRSTPEGRTDYIQSDMNAPETLLADPALGRTLDLAEPVALTVIAMLQFVADAQNLIETLMEPLAPGSYLAVTLATADLAPGSEALAREYTQRGIPMYLRDRAEVEGLFAGLDLVEPGVVPMTSWRPAPGDEVPDTTTNMYAGVARKP
ncbi:MULTISPECIES: SAM-dependent methyltransferase [unclassified Streptomyces]|uniref:SAM-dependent methyltransferase n=1 Tax=unclassified Streptomyces TaxID=2593676 RepID=UPI00202435C6|nr:MULTISPECIES: SAM-dependent methyltransferase [unclassified Streptomyces]MCX4553315.1 SAM-dependent methyltransferase [Streptomyces sp. NBC_01500]